MVKVLVTCDSRYPLNREVLRRGVIDTLGRNRDLWSKDPQSLIFAHPTKAEFAQNSISGEIEVSVAVVGQRKMDELCKKYMPDGKKHEVLSFPYEDASSAPKAKKHGFVNAPDAVLRLGDIILCWPQVVLKAAEDGVLVSDEMYLLTAHSTEHLLGKHHE